MSNPELAKDILYKIPFSDVVRTGADISHPVNPSHRVSIKFNAETGKFEGIPTPILKLLEEKGLTVEQVVNDPSLANFLYDLNMDEILKDS